MSKSKNGIVQVSAKNGNIKLYSPKYLNKDTTGFPQLIIDVHFPEICIERTKKDGTKYIWKEEERNCHRYLSPFREYGFQISGTWNGEWCCADTQVIGLHNLFNAILDGENRGRSNVRWGYSQLTRGHAMWHVFNGFAESAVMDWYNNSDFEGYDGINFNWTDGDSWRFSDRGDVFDQFVYAVIIYLAIREGKWKLIKPEDLRWYYSLPVLDDDKNETKLTIPMDILEYMCPEEETIKEVEEVL